MSESEMLTPVWWPPKVGDKLRKFMNDEQISIAKLCHVVAVFKHSDDVTRFVVAWYGLHKQWWHYEVVGPLQCNWEFWPDGTQCPNADLRKKLSYDPSSV